MVGPVLVTPASPRTAKEFAVPKLIVPARLTSAPKHLRSTEAVMGDHVKAVDGEIGHVTGFWWTAKLGRSAPSNQWALARDRNSSTA
jgi:hypothetical protein